MVRSVRRPTPAVAYFRSRFRAEGDPKQAPIQQAYMKSDLDFHGVTQPQIRKAARDYCAEHPLDHDELLQVVEDLFATSYFDLRSAAIAILERRRTLLGRADADWLLSLVRRASCWAHVDWLSTKVLPRALDANPSKQLRAWARDELFWVRRAALLAQHDALNAGEGDFELFAALAVPMLEEREFFIRKAIGWVLRATAKKRPQLVRAFVAQHGERMSGLTRREALKHLG
jgi:3-methyladenine DNA glycosylase AlkD